VSPDRLLTAIKQEMLRNKKKSAILGVMCLVAAYFWVPLIWGWIAPDDLEEDSLESAAPADFVVPAEPSVMAAAPETAPPPRRSRATPWDELLRTIQEDPRMASAELGMLPRSPFAPLKSEEPSPPAAEASPPSQATAVERPQLADLDLELTGIVYGPRFRVATINGTEYHENDLLRVSIAGEDSQQTATSNVLAAEDDVGEKVNPPVPRTAAERYARGEISMAELLQMQSPETSGDDPTQRDEGALPAGPQPEASAQASAEAKSELTCRVAAIRPHYVVLQCHDGTTRELRMSGARMSAGDLIQVSKRGRVP